MGIPTKSLAAAGIAAPVVFTTLVLVQELLQPDYSRVALPISALAAWPLGWLQNLSFLVYGLLLLAYVVSLDRGVAPTRGGRAGIALLAVSALGALVAGWFPWKRLDGQPIATAEHVLGAITHFLGSALRVLVFSRRMAADPRWKDLSGYALASGVAMLLLFLVTAFFAVGPGRPLHPWAGLLQRVTVIVWFTWVIVLAVRLRRLV